MASKKINLRVRLDALEQIDRLASSVGLSRSEYMVRASLGQTIDGLSAEERLDQLETRLARIEELATLGG